MARKEKSEYIIQAVSHALDLLEQFHGNVDELGVTELSKRLKLHKNNVFRLLATLESRGYIEQNKATENYRLGLKSLALGQTFIKQMGLLRNAQPILAQLKQQANETCYAATFKDGLVFYLDVVETEHAVRVVSRVGVGLPAHAAAAGKVHLAAMGEDELAEVFPSGTLEARTAKTLTTLVDLKAELVKVASQGYALDDEEMDLGVRCIAVPIRDYTRRVVGALSISGPTMRFSDQRIAQDIIPLIRDAGAQLSARLGFGS